MTTFKHGTTQSAADDYITGEAIDRLAERHSHDVVLRALTSTYGEAAVALRRDDIDARFPSVLPLSRLLEDRARAHRIAKTLARKLDVDLVTALDRITSKMISADRAGQTITLGKAGADWGIDIDQLEREHRNRQREIAASVTTPHPGGRVNAQGQVMFASTVDLDRLLHDEVAPARAHRKARDLGLDVENRERFAETWRIYTDAGVDLVATLQLEQHENEVAEAIAADEARRDRQTRFDREQAVRDAEMAAAEAQKRADELRAKSKTLSATQF